MKYRETKLFESDCGYLKRRKISKRRFSTSGRNFTGKNRRRRLVEILQILILFFLPCF